MGINERELELLTQYESDLIRTLNLSYLIPHLTKCRLLSSNDEDVLTKSISELTRQDSIRKFLAILKTKGQTAFSLFMDALKNEKDHLGHESLHKMLTNADKDHSHTYDRLGLYSQETATPTMYEPHPSTGMTHSFSGHSLCSCSEVSHFSSQGSSAAASSIGSEALSSGLASVRSELSSIKTQIADNSEMMNEFGNELKKISATLQRTSPSSNGSTQLRRRPSLARLGKSDSSISQSFDMSKQNAKSSTKKAQPTAADPEPIQVTKMVSDLICSYVIYVS